MHIFEYAIEIFAGTEMCLSFQPSVKLIDQARIKFCGLIKAFI